MEYTYPHDLIPIMKKKWNTFQARLNAPEPVKESGRKKSKGSGKTASILPSPFPDDKSLKTLLDVIYHVSFLTEESRRIAGRVAYIPPNCSDENIINHLNHHKPPIKFLTPNPFTIGEVLRLAPAIEPTQSILAVCPSQLVGLDSDSYPLAIWGILDLGTKWWNLLSGRSSSALVPPNFLTISTFAPGNLTVSSSGEALLRLQAGQLIGVPLDNLSEGFIGEFLEKAAKELYDDVIKEMHVSKYDEKEDSDSHPQNLYYRTLSNIINLAKERHHGGTFIVLPDEIGITDRRLKDRLSIKYSLESPNIWKHLVNESIASRKYFDFLFPERLEGKYTFLLSKDDASAEDLKSLISWERSRENAQSKIFEFENFVSNLSAVDGAVVLTKKLKVLGFGTEIIAHSPSLESIKMANDPVGKTFSDRPLTAYGTRHRSAIRLCSSFEDCVAFVISQDGFVRVVKGVESDLFVWDYIREARISL